MVSLPNLVVVCYPFGAGGKTVLNSLALSNQCAFQHSKLVKGIKNKEKFLLSQFTNTKDWNDLNMGDKQFFGRDYRKQMQKGSYSFSKVLSYCVKYNLYAFITAHDEQEYSMISKYFKDFKVIQLTNVVYFIHEIRKFQTQNYDSIRGADWPKKMPIDLVDIEFNNLSETVKSEIRNFYNRWPECENIGEKFDCMNFLSEHSFLNGVRLLFDKLRLLDYQDVEPSLKKYYNKWKDFNLKEI